LADKVAMLDTQRELGIDMTHCPLFRSWQKDEARIRADYAILKDSKVCKGLKRVGDTPRVRFAPHEAGIIQAYKEELRSSGGDASFSMFLSVVIDYLIEKGVLSEQ